MKVKKIINYTASKYFNQFFCSYSLFLNTYVKNKCNVYAVALC